MDPSMTNPFGPKPKRSVKGPASPTPDPPKTEQDPKQEPPKPEPTAKQEPPKPESTPAKQESPKPEPAAKQEPSRKEAKYRAPDFNNGMLDRVVDYIKENIVPAENLTVNSRELQDFAVIAEREINEDIEAYRDKLLLHGTNKDAFYHMLERLVDRLLIHWTNASNLLQEEVRTLAEQGKTRAFEEMNNSPEARRQQDLQALDSWIRSFEELVADIPAEKADFATLNKKLRDLIDHLLAGIDLGLNVASKYGKYMKEGDIKLKLQNLRKTCEKDQYSIIAVGLEKAGKSTLSSNLIGYDLLPRAAERCTMITTVVRSSPSPKLEIEILFFDREQFEANLAEAIEEDPSLAARREEIVRNYEDLRGKGSMVLSGDFAEMKKTLQDYVANKNRMYSVKSVVVKTDKLKSEVPYEIFDVPGYDSTLSSHRAMAERAIETADAFIFPTNGKQPSLTEPAVALLKKIEQMSPSKNMFERGFAVITNLDRCETPQKATRCLEDSRAELQKYGFKPQQIFPVCAALDLLKIKSTNDSLTKEEQTELANLEALVRRDVAFLRDGVSNFKKSLLAYMGSELPKARAKEAVDFGRDVKNAIQKLLDALRKDSDSVQSMNPTVEKKKQWALAWETIWRKSLEMANEWKWHNVTNTRAPFFNEVVESFEREFVKTTNEEDSRAVNLKARVPKSAAMVGLVDVPQIEQDERMRLTNAHLKKAQKCSEVIAKMIYQKLEEFCDNLFSSIGIDYPSEELLCYFNLETIVPRATCFAQIEALVMRVAFPLGLAYLRWRRPHENRKKAEEELATTCPEIDVEHTHQRV